MKPYLIQIKMAGMIAYLREHSGNTFELTSDPTLAEAFKTYEEAERAIPSHLTPSADVVVDPAYDPKE